MDADRLAKVPLFSELSHEERVRIARWADEVSVPAGYHLLEQGRFPHEFFVVEEGTVSILRDGEQLATLGPGDFFGEIAIVEHERRTATVVADTPVTAIVMVPRDFDAMRREMPEVARRVEAAVRERMPR
jgi:CRP/FNR family cyclic AMP-dependent transcriptional regulator